jgi:hypothetical protein
MTGRNETDLLQGAELWAQTPDFRQVVPIPDVDGSSFTSRFNSRCSGEFTLPAAHPVNRYLRTPGAGVIVRHRDAFKMSGMIRDPQGSIARNGDTTWQVEGDWRILDNTLAVPAPRRPLQPATMAELGQSWQTSPPGPNSVTQGRTGYFRFPDGIDSAEACIKHLIGENALVRLGRPIAVEPNQDRGGDARAAGLIEASEIRMQTLTEALQPFLDFSGLRLRVSRVAGLRGYYIETIPTTTFDTPLDYDNGILSKVDYTRKDPTVTRVITGSVGEAAERVFRSYQSLALENEYGGDIIEVFHEDSDAELPWKEGTPDGAKAPVFAHLSPHLSKLAMQVFEATLSASSYKRIAEGRAQLGLEVTIDETPAFYLGGADGIQDGTKVTVIAEGVEYDDRLTSSTITQDGSFSVSGTLGTAPTSEDDEIWEQIDSLMTAFQKRSE